MTSYLDTIGLDLSQKTETGLARNQVLGSIPWAPTPTTQVAYVSSNRVLIIAALEQAQSIESRLGQRLQMFIAVPADRNSPSNTGNAWNVGTVLLTGYLGRFTVHLNDDAAPGESMKDNNLGKLMGIHNGLFDHVIDCSDTPLISAAIKPPGYYYAGNEQKLPDQSVLDQSALDQAIEQIPQFIGEFEKPKFFEYDPGICAHGRSGIKGCHRCIDACPTDAIISIGEQIEVSPHLCQGGGTCASSCPSGAISYRYPGAEEQIEFLRIMMRDLRNATENRGITLLIYDREHGAEYIVNHNTQLPEHVVPMVLEEIGSAGLDLIASAMAYGANRVIVYAPLSISAQVIKSLHRDIKLLQEIFTYLNLPVYQINLVRELAAVFSSLPDTTELNLVATYAGIGNKRSIIGGALQFFHHIAEGPGDTIALPEDSIFGRIKLNTEICTLCMACVSVCPANALEAGGETPALKFIEANCLQCGICTRACPESALELEPRFNFDNVNASRNIVLKEEEPFRCLKCNKPFTTQAMIQRMINKLKGHWMFETPEALNRLKMCEDCRVADMFDRKDMIG